MVHPDLNPSARGLRQFAAAVAALLFLSVCSASPAPGTHGPPSSVPATPGICTPVDGGIPSSIAGFRCLRLISISGSDNTGKLAWLGTDPFTFKTSILGGKLQFGG